MSDKPTPCSGASVTDGCEVVEGSDLRIYFDGKRCIHARYCVAGAPKTFLANVEGEWIYPDQTETSHLVHIAKSCPSGAIQYDGGKTVEDETPPEVNRLRVWENGPYGVTADIVLDGESDGYRRVLCRCGLSKHKPYCDGSHNGGDGPDDPVDVFVATGEPATRDMTALKTRNGPLRIDPLKNGPLMISGNLEIMAGTGRGVERTQSCRLCRCGASQTKPFCDGSHAAIGFKSDD